MICKKLEENNFLSQCWFDKKNRNIKAEIKYSNQKSCINQLKKISKPSQHIYLKVEELKKYCRSYGVYLISTSVGLLTHREALEKNISGKVILSIN
jgi:small subunit ribosomal protein S8